MELSRLLLVCGLLLLAAGAGIWIALAVRRMWVAPRWLQRRRMAKHAPPRGSRPEVHLVFEGVTYDLTETLLDAGVQAGGTHLWVTAGPGHIRLSPEQPGFWLDVPYLMPVDTVVEVPVTSSGERQQLRFMTAQEIRVKYPHAR